MKQKLSLLALMLIACISIVYAEDSNLDKVLKIDDWGAISQGQSVTVKDATGKFIVDIAGEGAKIKTEANKRDMYLNPQNVMECPMANGYRLSTGGKAGSMTLTLPAETGGLYIYTHTGTYGRQMHVMKKSEEINLLPPNTKIEGVDAYGRPRSGYEYQKVYITKADIDTKNNNVTATITWDAGSIYICGFCFVPGEKIPDDYFKVKPYAVYDNGTLTFRYDNKWGEADGNIYPISNYSSRSWDEIAGSTTSVVFDPSFAQCTEITSTYAWFSGFKSLTSITGLENLNTQNVTTMYSMFYNCSSLTSLDVSSFDTKNVTDMSGMFANCSSLTSLDVTNFNTENVTNMSGMFAGCSSLTSINVRYFIISNVTTMSQMFYGCSSLTTLDIVFPSMAMKLTSMSYMFANCSGLTSISVRVYTGDVTDMYGMFANCSGLSSIDVSNFCTENVTNMSSMFYGCTGLSVLDLRNFNIKRLSEATNLYAACNDNLIVYLPEGWNADKVTRIASLVPIGDYLYNIYKDKHAVLAYLNRPITIAGDVVVPNKVEFQSEEYRVSKVGRMSFAASTSENNVYTYLTDEEYAKVSSITFEDGIEEIDCADIAYFSHCNSINIPKSVKYISPKTYQLYGISRSYEDYMGHNCNDITFNVDAENSVYKSVDGVLYDKEMKTLLRCPRNRIEPIIVPETVETIGDLAFANCEQLTGIELPKGLKSIGTPEESTSYFEGVFQRCYALYAINIPAGVKYIGTSAFRNCNYLESITCYIKNPEGYNDENRFYSRVYERAALYVPFGTRDKYLATDGWKNFANIVEMPQELEPIEDETVIEFDDKDYIVENTPVDLNNTVINDMYISMDNKSDVNNPDGFYDSTEKCMVINKATSSDAIATAVASDLGSYDFISNYTGIVIEVNGQGSVKINAQTIGNNKLAVKIGSADAMTYKLASKGDVAINYDVTENTYVYIYAVDANNQQQSLSMDVTDTSDNAVKVYSVTVTPDATAIETVTETTIPAAVFGKVYSIDGKQFSQPQKGLNILKMSDGTTRKVVK